MFWNDNGVEKHDLLYIQSTTFTGVWSAGAVSNA